MIVCDPAGRTGKTVLARYLALDGFDPWSVKRYYMGITYRLTGLESRNIRDMLDERSRRLEDLEAMRHIFIVDLRRNYNMNNLRYLESLKDGVCDTDDGTMMEIKIPKIIVYCNSVKHIISCIGQRHLYYEIVNDEVKLMDYYNRRKICTFVPAK